MSELCSLHSVTGVENPCSLSERPTSRIGNARIGQLLRRYDVTYEQFGKALHDVNHGEVSDTNAHKCSGP